LANVLFQAFADSSRRVIVQETSAMRVALFNELWKQKLINNFDYCLQQH